MGSLTPMRHLQFHRTRPLPPQRFLFIPKLLPRLPQGQQEVLAAFRTTGPSPLLYNHRSLDILNTVLQKSTFHILSTLTTSSCQVRSQFSITKDNNCFRALVVESLYSLNCMLIDPFTKNSKRNLQRANTFTSFRDLRAIKSRRAIFKPT